MGRANYRKICIMHRASIGDMLLATPVYRAVKKRYPESELVVVTNHAGYEMFYGNPYIDKLVAYQKEDPIWTHLPAIRAMWRSDVALIMDIHHRNATYAFLAQIPIRVGRGKDFINQKPQIIKRNDYCAWNFLGFAKAIGASSEDIRLEPLRATAEEKRRVQEELGVIRKKGQRMVIIVPYSLSPLKDWEPEKYRDIIQRFHKNQWLVVMLGGKKEADRIEREYPMAVNLAGKWNLREAATLIASADLQISGCTAMLHICATTNTPSIALYGPTDPVHWAPRRNCHVITKHFSCSPCYSTDKECGNNKCMQAISVDDVWSAVIKIQEKRDAGTNVGKGNKG